MSKRIKRYKEYYEAGFWTLDAVIVLLKNGKITPDEFKDITGEGYKASEETNA